MVWKNFKNNPLFDILIDHPTIYYEDEKDFPNLDINLTSIPPEVIFRKQILLTNPSMKQAMLFLHPAQTGDTFHQILNVHVCKLPHEISVYLRNREKILNWTVGPVGDQKPWKPLKCLHLSFVIHDSYVGRENSYMGWLVKVVSFGFFECWRR